MRIATQLSDDLGTAYKVPHSENVLAVEEDSVLHIAPLAGTHPPAARRGIAGLGESHLLESLELHPADQTAHGNASD